MTLTRRSLLLSSAGFAALSATGAWAQAAPIEDFSVGSPDAKVVLAEYLSVTCPHCQHFHEATYPQLKAEYLDTGKVRLEIHEVYRNQYDLYGALVARCGGPMRYVGIVDLLFDKQAEWAGASDVNGVVEELKKIGRTAGMNDDQIMACLQDNAMAEALVADFQADMAKAFPNDSFGGTPSFLINGVLNPDINSNIAYADLKAILDAELAK